MQHYVRNSLWSQHVDVSKMSLMFDHGQWVTSRFDLYFTDLEPLSFELNPSSPKGQVVVSA